MKAMTWILGGVGALVALGILFVVVERFMFAAPRYTGVVSDHFDGERFFNPGGVKETGLADVLRWVINRDQGVWTEADWKTRPDAPTGEPPPRRVDGDSLRITFVNHATVLIQTAGVNILTDPVWSERVSPFPFAGPKRVRQAGIRFEDLPQIDVILLSHNHYDHLDIETLKRLHAAFHPAIYVPLGVKAFLERESVAVTGEMDWKQSLPMQGGLTLHCVQAQHFSGRGLSDRNATLWCGYVISSGIASGTSSSNISSSNIYFAGDTGYNQHFKRLREQFGSFRAALIPIGAFRPEWFMAPVHISPKEAVQAFQDLGAPPSVGIHFGTFPLADDGEDEPVKALHAALQQAGINAQQFMALKEGEGRQF